MPEKKATYRINESMLRNTLLGYTVEVDAAKCSVIEQEASAIRMQKSFVMPETKVLVKFVALPLLLIGVCILVYANIDAIQSAFTPTPQPVVKTEKKIVATPPVVTQQTVASVNNTPPPVVTYIVAKHDTVIAVTNKITDSAKQEKAKHAVPVIAGPPTDSATTNKAENLAKTNKVDTASQKSNEPPVKKKKKRRRRSNNLDDLKESTLQPNSADDDVVVPQ